MKEEVFTLTDLIRFGHYVRANPDIDMRKNYLTWEEKIRTSPFEDTLGDYK